MAIITPSVSVRGHGTCTYRLVISSANITVANGVITSWTANNDETIQTTNISSIIN